MTKTFKLLSIFTLVELILHTIWEYSVCGLFYTMAGQGPLEHQLLMLQAIIGDLFIAYGLFLLLAFVNKRSNWFLDGWERKDYAISILYSIAVSFYFEVHALYNKRWGYQGDMPLVPGTPIALLPVLQLIIILTFGFWLSKKIYLYKFD